MLLWVIIFSAVLLVLIPLYLLGRIVKKRAEEVRGRFDESEIILATSHANYFGQESLGAKQLRGNGYLILTEEVLYFMMLLPKRETVISLQAVTGCEITPWHIGKSKSRPLLKVIYTDEKGESDSGAWLIGAPNKWKEEIEELISGQI